jgi:hypothetical protein
MLIVPAGQLGYPVGKFILMETNDGLLHVKFYNMRV